MKQINSLKSEPIQLARALNKPSSRTAYCLLEDEAAIDWAIKADIPLTTVFVQKGKHPEVLERIEQNSCYELTQGLMQKVVNSKYVGEMIAVADCRGLNQPTLPAKTLILDNLQDQGNIGSIIRSAKAFGFEHIVGVEGKMDLFSKKAITASRGTCFAMTHHWYASEADLTEALKMQNVEMIVSTSYTDQLVNDLAPSDKIAVVMGNETHGACEALLTAADTKVRIPMDPSVESLNVSAAASILLFMLGS